MPWTLRSVKNFQRNFHIAGFFHTRPLKRQHWWQGILPLTDRLLAPCGAKARFIAWIAVDMICWSWDA
jgi:hypothetical protein